MSRGSSQPGPVDSDFYESLFLRIAESGSDGPPVRFYDLESEEAIPSPDRSGLDQVRSLNLDEDSPGQGLPHGTLSPPDFNEKSTLWLAGDVLMCSCPDCGAPLSVRLWLMAADCWQCEACVELTEEQQQQAQQLIEQAQQAQAESDAATPASTSTLDQPIPPQPAGTVQTVTKESAHAARCLRDAWREVAFSDHLQVAFGGYWLCSWERCLRG